MAWAWRLAGTDGLYDGVNRPRGIATFQHRPSLREPPTLILSRFDSAGVDRGSSLCGDKEFRTFVFAVGDQQFGAVIERGSPYLSRSDGREKNTQRKDEDVVAVTLRFDERSRNTDWPSYDWAEDVKSSPLGKKDGQIVVLPPQQSKPYNESYRNVRETQNPTKAMVAALATAIDEVKSSGFRVADDAQNRHRAAKEAQQLMKTISNAKKVDLTKLKALRIVIDEVQSLGWGGLAHDAETLFHDKQWQFFCQLQEEMADFHKEAEAKETKRRRVDQTPAQITELQDKISRLSDEARNMEKKFSAGLNEINIKLKDLAGKQVQDIKNEVYSMDEKMSDEMECVKRRLSDAEEKCQTMTAELATQTTTLKTTNAKLAEVEAVGKATSDLVCRVDNKNAFFTLYKTVPEPRTAEDVFANLKDFVTEMNLELKATSTDVDNFLKALRSDADPNHSARDTSVSDVAWTGARLWTSDQKLRNKPLYSMLSQANRDDKLNPMQKGGVALQKSVNAALVNRGVVVHNWPSSWDFKSYRGSGISKEALNFWRVMSQQCADKRIYRIAAPLATSINKAVAEGFRSAVAPPLLGVLFVCHWKRDSTPCLHARYIDSVSACKGEQELLLAGFSAVQLRSFHKHSDPITIEIDILYDNRTVAESVPLALWH